MRILVRSVKYILVNPACTRTSSAHDHDIVALVTLYPHFLFRNHQSPPVFVVGSLTPGTAILKTNFVAYDFWKNKLTKRNLTLSYTSSSDLENDLIRLLLDKYPKIQFKTENVSNILSEI